MTHRILLADDSVTIRKVVELTFSDEDYTIDSVGDGAQAFEHARTLRPDIIISDVIMPGLNGYELCRQVKTDPALQSVPFLLLKGTFESFDEEEARSCGADGVITKPFESQELIAKVAQLIERALLAAAAVPAAPAPAFVAAERTPIETEARTIPARPEATPIPPSPMPAAILAAPPRPAVAPPGLVPQQRQAPPPAPPAIPTMQPRQTPAPPPIPAPPARPAPPIPPIPPRPVRPAMVAPPTAPQPPRPTPPIHQPPPPPPPPPAPAVSVQTPNDDFGFDFGEDQGDRFGAFAAPPEIPKPAAAPPDTSGESDEDLWSEVSLRGSPSDLLGDRGGSGATPDFGIVELAEETAITAPDMLFEEESEFEEVSAARTVPPADVLAPASPREEPAVAPAPAVLPSAAPAATVSLDQAEIERIVASRVEAAVRKVLEPLVSDLARTTIEAVAWEVIPDLAEAMIQAEIERVRKSTRTD